MFLFKYLVLQQGETVQSRINSMNQVRFISAFTFLTWQRKHGYWMKLEKVQKETWNEAQQAPHRHLSCICFYTFCVLNITGWLSSSVNCLSILSIQLETVVIQLHEQWKYVDYSICHASFGSTDKCGINWSIPWSRHFRSVSRGKLRVPWLQWRASQWKRPGWQLTESLPSATTTWSLLEDGWGEIL